MSTRVLFLRSSAAALSLLAASAVAEVSPDGLWRDASESTVGRSAGAVRDIVPTRYRTVSLDFDGLGARLERAPMERTAASDRGDFVLTLPLPDGGFGRFAVEESPIMEPELQRQFPEIRTYRGRGIDDPTASVRFDRTPSGFHAQILGVAGRVFIDPYQRGDTATYISYFTRDYVKPGAPFRCDVKSHDDGVVARTPNVGHAAIGPYAASGATLRTYRLALACTAEYTSFQGGTVPLAMAAMTTSMNRVNGIYEKEVAIHMNFVANESMLIYTAAGIPYTNNDPNALLAQNQSNCDSVIGSSNYDIGHVFSTAGGGLAALGVVCLAGSKAEGETGTSSPVGDAFDVDYVAHEMGHQFGGNHTFNGTVTNCGGGNREPTAAYEPGSGSTIMAYAGICGSVNLQPHSDPYFHTKSFDEIVAYTTTGGGSSCAAATSTGNAAPTVNAGTAHTIPISTPFALTGSASDPGDTLTYCWEEFDLGPALNTNTDNGSSPIFRSFNPVSSPTRTFPKLADLLANTTTFGEVLPTTTRTMTFRLTARDNKAGGGGVNYASTTVSSTTAAGPFQVTAPNTALTWISGSTQSVTWNVASTTAAPVSCANVDILLSTDGGNTFPTTILAATPNDGSQSVTVPGVTTTQARVKVACSNNIFFDISNVNFTITCTGETSAPVVTAPAAATVVETICQ